jgi:polar amino acid transport system permease protein
MSSATALTAVADPPVAHPRAPELATRRALPRRHVGRWVVSAVVVVLLAELVRTIASNPTYQWDAFPHYFTRPFILQGVQLTLEVTLYSAVLGFVLGVVLALARLSGNPLLNGLSWLYTWFFRSLPIPVLLIILFNLSAFFPTLGLAIPFGPTLFGTDTQTLLTPLAAGVLGLAINEAAFAAELIRGGILSVDQGQVEAAHALGLSTWRRMRRVVLPQALRAIVPGYVNQLIGLVKASSLVYYVSLVDLFGAVFVLESRLPHDIVPILLVGSAWYLVLAAVLSVVQFYVERFFARGAVRTLPPTPLQRLRSRVRSLRTLATRAEEAR